MSSGVQPPTKIHDDRPVRPRRTGPRPETGDRTLRPRRGRIDRGARGLRRRGVDQKEEEPKEGGKNETGGENATVGEGGEDGENSTDGEDGEGY
ncbi:hypothetical protein [Natronococcus wangiae]|uniref:hypothetical protein n=1 Tax=Natronococcus wangiae TaxID=3068275 RepID=UPI00273EEF65|nr:hypothetical protein [Natronococcus sp. AD5]